MREVLKLTAAAVVGCGHLLRDHVLLLFFLRKSGCQAGPQAVISFGSGCVLACCAEQVYCSLSVFLIFDGTKSDPCGMWGPQLLASQVSCFNF